MKTSTYIKSWNKGEHAFHWHEKIEIARCRKGAFSILMDGVKYTLGEGDVCVIAQETVHKFIISEDDTEIVILQFPSSVLLKSDIKIIPVKPLVRKDELMDVCGESFEALLGILGRDGCVEKDVNDEFSRHLYAGLYHLLMKHFPAGENEKTSGKDKKDRNVFYNVVNYVSQNFCDNINVQSVANALYMDRGRLSKLFLKYAGVTLNDYINSLRLVNVKKLTDSGMTVTSAALESGFQSLRTYNNVKKKLKSE